MRSEKFFVALEELGRYYVDLPKHRGDSEELTRELGDDFFPDGADWGVYGARLTLRLRVGCDSPRYPVEVTMEGSVTLECDRCLQRMDFPLGFSGVLVLQRAEVGEVQMEEDDWMIPQEAERVDIGPWIRESIYLSVPMRHYHGLRGTSEGDCNPSVLELIGSDELGHAHHDGMEDGGSEGTLAAQLREALGGKEANDSGH